MIHLYELPLTPKEGRALGGFVCARCRRVLCVKPGEITTGYGTTAAGRRHCVDCCAATDRRAMIRTGRAVLYLTFDGRAHGDKLDNPVGEITNWPGTLRFPARVVARRHNIAGRQYFAYFTGPDRKPWTARQVGDMTQIAHCRRTKSA